MVARVIRRWLVTPDVEVQTAQGPLAVVSPDLLAHELAQAATILYREGGLLSIVQSREPGLIEGEMLPTGVVFEWRDRTDAKEAPERPAEAVPPATAQQLEELVLVGREETDFLQRPPADERAVPLDEEEVDESSIPVALRG